MDIDILGSYNTLKATLPYLVESGKKHRMDSSSRMSSSIPYSLGQANTGPVKPSPGGPGGRIIFVSATLHYRGMPFQTHVSVAKAGIDSLSNSVAIEYGPRGVTSNIIAPGPIAQTEVGCIRLTFHLFRGCTSDIRPGLGTPAPIRRQGCVHQVAASRAFRTRTRHRRRYRLSLLRRWKLCYWSNSGW